MAAKCLKGNANPVAFGSAAEWVGFALFSRHAHLVTSDVRKYLGTPQCNIVTNFVCAYALHCFRVHIVTD